MKIIYINKEDVKDEFIKENPEYASKRNQMEVTVDERYGSMMRIGRKVLITHSLYDENILYIEIGNTYGYCRISRKEQSIDRQIRNIKDEYPSAIIFQETYTGRSMDRTKWKQMLQKIRPGDRIIFDSVSRMSRSADEGLEIYFELYEQGIQLVFLKEHYIDTEVYASASNQSIPETGNDIADIYIDATNKVIRLLAEQQIRKAFEQAEKEVEDLRQRTSEGIRTAKLNGKQIGQKPGKVLTVKKKAPAKEIIKKHCKDFGGSLTDPEVIELAKVSRNTFYKYKKEIREEL